MITDPKMHDAISQLVSAIYEDYNRWVAGRDFTESKPVEVKFGSKYIKLIRDRSVWGFVVNTESDSKFKRGDILMAAGWAAPARNKARGNVLDGDLSWVQWTGPKYI